MFFSSKKKKPAVDDNAALQKRLADTIQYMKQTSENLEKRVEHLNRLRDDCRLKGQKCLKSGDKVAAKNQLIYMRKYEKEIQSLYGKRMNLETQVMALQSTAVDREVLNAMRMGRDVMRTVSYRHQEFARNYMMPT